MKRVLTALLIPVFLFTLFGCSLQPEQKEDSGDAIQSSQETVEPSTTGSPESTDAVSEASAEPELPQVRAIVFDETIEDPASELTPFTGQAALSLTLIETAPGVFEGQGLQHRQTEMQAMSSSSSDAKYRLSFPQITAGQAGQLTVLMQNITEQSQVWGDRAELGTGDIHLFTTQQMPLEYQLSLEGNAAQLYMKLVNFEFNFTGEYRQVMPAAPDVPLSRLAGRCISINSTFYESGQSYNDEYRAMLTATQASGYEYSGDLCVYGSGNDIPFADETVSFTLETFDAQAYKSAGGRLSGSFDAFGVISGGYIVLIDGEKAILEAANSDYAFYGRLLPVEQAVESQHIADETKQLMRMLYDNCDKTKFSVGGAMKGGWQGKPPWYPDWLLPKPFASYSWFWYEMANELGYNRYRVQYDEELHWLEEVLESYTRQLSGNKNFESHTYFADDEAEATIYFTKGAFSIWMVLSEFSNGTEVVIYII